MITIEQHKQLSKSDQQASIRFTENRIENLKTWIAEVPQRKRELKDFYSTYPRKDIRILERKRVKWEQELELLIEYLEHVK